jgi:catechol 2,3-dioxygenase
MLAAQSNWTYDIREEAMALTGILRPGYVQIRVKDIEASIKHYVDRIGLTLVSRESDGRVYLKAWDEFDRHSIVLRRADAPGMDAMGFKVSRRSDLDHFKARIERSGIAVDMVPAGEQPGVGQRLGFVIPSGHRIELFAEMDQALDGPAVSNPDVWHEEPRGMRAMRFDHCLLYGPKIPETTRFFTDVLDFALTEKIDSPDGMIGAFLSCATKAHDIAFVMHQEPGKFHHVSFLLESWHDVGHAADVIARYDVPLDIGPTRHGITRGQTIYFFDPSGNRNEVFAGGYSFYPDNPTRVWGVDQLGKAIFYYQKELNDRFLSVVT